MISGHGDDIYSQSAKVKGNFSSNVDNLQDLSSLRLHLCSCIEKIHAYPEPAAHSFAKLLAEKNSVSVDNICVTNGATEAIYLIAQAFYGVRSSVIIPTFSEYEDASTLNQHQLSFHKSLADIATDTALVWMCNPNNPTGSIFSKDEILSFLDEHPNSVVVIDQSYEQFCPEQLFTISEAIQYKRIILLHSLTKHFAIPGLRLGYLSGAKELVEKVNRYRMPWSVNQLAIEAGLFLETHYTNLVDLNAHLKNAELLFQGLIGIKNLSVTPSNTHFFLCKIEDSTKTAQELKTYLMDMHGLLIRDASNFRGLTPQHFRVASQTPDLNVELINAIKSWL